jgi:protein-L-isoaspartate O-methyltransferase
MKIVHGFKSKNLCNLCNLWIHFHPLSVAAGHGECSENPATKGTDLMTIPQRIAAAVEHLAPQPDDQILEIGCGNGAAAALVCERLEGGHLVAIDRSEKQIGVARERLRPHLQAGRASLYVMALESASLYHAKFDKIFAINVNCFWLRYEQPLAAVKQLLKPDGMFFIFYEHPTTAKMVEVAPVLRRNLVASGFAIRRETMSGPVYCLASSPQIEGV